MREYILCFLLNRWYSLCSRIIFCIQIEELFFFNFKIFNSYMRSQTWTRTSCLSAAIRVARVPCFLPQGRENRAKWSQPSARQFLVLCLKIQDFWTDERLGSKENKASLASSTIGHHTIFHGRRENAERVKENLVGSGKINVCLLSLPKVNPW